MPTPQYTALATITLGSSAATVTFSSIPATYRDLRLVMMGTISAGSDNVYCQVNALTGASMYNRVVMSGDGASATSSTDSDSSGSRFTLYSAWNVTEIANTTVDFLDYAATDKHKSMLSRGNRAGTGTEAMAHRVASTAAITSLKLTLYAGASFAAGSTFCLYGVK